MHEGLYHADAGRRDVDQMHLTTGQRHALVANETSEAKVPLSCVNERKRVSVHERMTDHGEGTPHTQGRKQSYFIKVTSERVADVHEDHKRVPPRNLILKKALVEEEHSPQRWRSILPPLAHIRVQNRSSLPVAREIDGIPRLQNLDVFRC